MRNKFYTELTGLQHWEIIKLMAEGEQLYVHTFKDYTVATETDVAAGFAIYKEEIIDWRSKLDDTVENCALCWVYDHDKNQGRYAIVIVYNKNTEYPYVDNTGNIWMHADPVEQELLAKIVSNTIDAIRDEEQKQEQSL